MLTTTAQKAIAFFVTLVLVVGGLTAMLRGGRGDVIEVTAQFKQSVGLYPGSSVRVLGVPVGTIRSVTPDGPHVTVVMEIPAGTPIPAGATAVIIPPSLVSDRYVELTPVYDGGARMTDGAVLGLDHTMTPVELDEILSSLDTFLVALGPQGANKDGSLGQLVDIGAKTFGNGGGEDFNDTITSLADAVKTLADNRGDLTGTLTNLAAFTGTLARNDAKIKTLTATLADATQYLASERTALAEALKNLAIALGEIAGLVRDHRAELGSDIQSLAKITQVVVKHRDSLIEALDVLPLGAANIAGSINTERDTLDIRNNNHQGDNGYSIAFCQIVFPLLGQPCPPEPAAASRGRASSGGAATPRTTRNVEAERLTDQLSPLLLIGGAS